MVESPDSLKLFRRALRWYALATAILAVGIPAAAARYPGSFDWADTNRPDLLPCCHREGREARRGDPAGLLRLPPRREPRNDSVISSGDWYYTVISALASRKPNQWLAAGLLWLAVGHLLVTDRPDLPHAKVAK